jgi:hypothetical protein
MTQDAVAAVKAAIDSLTAAASRVANLMELGDPKPGHRPGVNRDDLEEIDDSPYDENLWDDSDSEAQHAQ